MAAIPKLGPLRLESGRIEADVVSDGPAIFAEIMLSVDGEMRERVEVIASENDEPHRIAATLPKDAMSDGRRIIAFVLEADGGSLGQFCLTAGTPDPVDLVDEVTRLRAELDLLKSAFRRHVRDST